MSHIVHFPATPPREERPSLYQQESAPHQVRQVADSQSSLIQKLLPFIDPCEAEDAFGAIGSMELLQVLGRGGMGCVCLAYDTFLERRVAIKFLLPHLLNDNVAVARFLREAQTAAAINHANVMPIYAIGEISSLPYLVMPYIEGGSLELKAARQLSAMDNVTECHVSISTTRASTYRLRSVSRGSPEASTRTTICGEGVSDDRGLHGTRHGRGS